MQSPILSSAPCLHCFLFCGAQSCFSSYFFLFATPPNYFSTFSFSVAHTALLDTFSIPCTMLALSLLEYFEPAHHQCTCLTSLDVPGAPWRRQMAPRAQQLRVSLLHRDQSARAHWRWGYWYSSKGKANMVHGMLKVPISAFKPPLCMPHGPKNVEKPTSATSSGGW